jgi:segregation and condensation protein A
LLPKDMQAPAGEEDEGEDPRWELIRQLVAYKKFKDAAALLQQREIAQENIYPRLPGPPDLPVPAARRPQASLFDLINAIQGVLKRIGRREDLGDIFEDKWSVSEKIEFLLKLTAERAVVKFSDLFAGAASRAEVVCTFLALLELIRLGQLLCAQPEDFGEIEITRASAQPVTA